MQLVINTLRADKENVLTGMNSLRKENEMVRSENDQMLRLIHQLQSELHRHQI
ncbi:hypothetical protein BC938DRAFT_476478 [Jimgerdemannia flammicorona]|uniref:Uncharacterized protein n=1 Tax=Jimgerdemannia flammicorona TaxID=994334 RepID=A0A433PGX7_9FUNG|nr:hypothetical protein BC938DRAFT_476478 [Jimgerdemannia flammicorona]